MRIETRPISELTPAEYNPRKELKPGDGEYEKLKRSLQEFGYVEPVIFNHTTGRVVGGHQRLTVLADLGYETVDAVIVELDETREKALNIALNKISGSWDEAKLALVIADLDAADFDAELTGFDSDEIQAMIGSLDQDDVRDDDFDLDAALQQASFVQPGDIWQVGRHRLACADATSTEAVKALMGGKSANLLVTDPPYNVDFKSASGLSIKNDKMDQNSFYEFLLAAFTAAREVMAPGASAYVFHADTEGLNFRRAFMDAGFKLSGCCIWVKDSLVLGRSPYQWQHEPCQPAGTMVRTANGFKPIEELVDGDKVLSYDSYSGQVMGARNGGYAVKTASRYFDGILYGVQVGKRLTWATPNHFFSVRFNPEARTKYCTYLMRRGDWWRVGITELYNARGFGLKGRLRSEHGDAAWVLDTFESKVEAQCAEQLTAVKYGIPYTHWETGRTQNPRSRTNAQVARIYAGLDLRVLGDNARRLLRDKHRDPDFPLCHKANGSESFSTRVTVKIHAANLLSDVMELPIPHAYRAEDCSNFHWEPISDILTKPFAGTVYSLDVEKFGHYIADGIITHNCLFGWRTGGKHAWYADRKQTTVWQFAKPKRNKNHPTSKPVDLLAYPIGNSTQEGAIVLDTFAGSGSTLIACEDTNRTASCMELDPKYASVILRRYVEHTGDAAGVRCERGTYLDLVRKVEESLK